jgi:hypothetical protein
MKSMTTFAMLALAGIAWNGTASAHEYNLRTIPVNPPAGAPFVAAFDSNECEVFFLPEPATPASVAVQGATVRIEVDRIYSLNCGAQPVSHTFNVQSLPAGNYQLELFARSFQALPGSGVFAQSISFHVAPATAARTFAIPTSDRFTLALLAGLLLIGYAIVRRR